MNLIYLLIEFVDELVFGVGEAAWPFIRNDLHLTYTQIGLLLSLPGIIAAFIEPFIGILGDVWKTPRSDCDRRRSSSPPHLFMTSAS